MIPPASPPTPRPLTRAAGTCARWPPCYTAYAETRDALGYGDEHVAAAQSHHRAAPSPDAWSGRPVFVYGFDDLTVEQLDLLGVLRRASEVSVAVAYEDRRALTARARLHQDLLERGGRTQGAARAQPRHTESQTLFHLERSFLRDGGPIASSPTTASC